MSVRLGLLLVLGVVALGGLVVSARYDEGERRVAAATVAAVPEEATMTPSAVDEVAPAPAADGQADGNGDRPRSRGCNKSREARSAPGSEEVRDLTSGGVRRSYRVHTGAAVDPATPAPVVLNFHGRGGTGAAIEAYSRFIPVSDQAGFILVSPDGAGSPSGWNAGASGPDWPVDDVQFASDLIRQVKDDYCVDPGRIYASGHSNGAFFAVRAACRLPGQIAAVATVAGVSVPAEGCARPVPLLAVHGTADSIVPFEGGPVRETFAYPGAVAQFTGYAALSGCPGAIATDQLSEQVSRQSELGCPFPLELVLIAGAGHGWPGVDGGNSLSTAETIWTFFRGRRSPAAD